MEFKQKLRAQLSLIRLINNLTGGEKDLDIPVKMLKKNHLSQGGFQFSEN